jgi:hypothetical protein
MHRHTQVQIRGEQFFVNGQPTYAGQSWDGHRIEGLLLNARLVQGIFDGLNPETCPMWLCIARTQETFNGASRQL